MNEFEIFNETNYEVEIKEIKELLEYALKYENITNTEFNIIFITNEEIKKINKEYRGIDRETDVISFALEDDNTFPISETKVLGDIYISVDRIISQAKEYGHSEKRECAFLAVHGLLHLLGYDHMTKEDEEVMLKKQEAILDGYGITR